ncbi:MAG: Smr/MutS family protein [Oscillospiraceae bacterium]
MPSTLCEINLEQGMPYVDAAIRRLTAELHQSVRMGVVVLKIIHGYGSSGTGGKIRTEARSYLAEQKQKRYIKDFIPGEDFSIFDESTRSAFLLCDDLRRDSDLERHNNGVTIVIL